MIYISIGSNIGNRLSHLQKATELLKKRYLKDLKSSIILETKAILPNGAPPDWNKPFLNMIVYGSCSSSPEELLKGLKQIECDIGRPQVYEKWAPRVIDLDILLWDDLTLDIPDLKIPHPELVNRPFLLHLMAMVNKTFAFNVQDCFSESFTLSPKLMGIVNITPDSFSDGGLYYDANRATKQALQLVSDGASIVDLGAQSTRPGASIQMPEEEYARLKPVLDNLSDYMKNGDIEVSIDSFWPDVILNVLKHYNIAWVNDQKGDLNGHTLKAVASSGCSIVIMHSLSIPPHKDNIIPHDTDPIDTINNWAEKSINRLLKLGFDENSIIIDPGIGFGKSMYQNIQILRSIETLQNFGCKVLVGHSRKSFISSFSTEPASNRDLETIATSAILHNKVDFLRVHNVRDHMRFFVAQAALQG
ncbi:MULTISPECIES: dihydropteroate synthase [Wolbachia]|uniref:dihydropteroate synthase n=1 Tax=Wolbachia TaxID=953 RepID=UPI000240420C|nr:MULTISPECIES: dihydropteroate synthase [Wolbachia]UYC23152.1 dihydropteroate synthase [Wolbachia endosymbiont of Aedes aegypti]QBB83449.1 dihydropteroate synthase [Wolbachia pipientis wAlbB]QDW09450.1 dihydropteroate synthase [Wolbachia pipientis]QZA83646.1 dihydropteroate synthase [Wolbachia pipientis]THA20363.1 dihydropteroate synthase [Wolbachia endosymbiont of Aedes albopictus]